MKSKYTDKIFSTFALFAIAVISIACNIGDFTGGSSGRINPLIVVITAVYIIYCTAFSLLAQNRKSIVTMTVWSVITFVVAVVGFVTSTFRLTIGIIIPFAIVFLTPFQGLVAVMSSNWTVIYSVMIVISILWVIFSIFNFRKHHKNIKATEN